MDADGQRARQRTDEIPTTVFLECDEGLAPGSGVGAEGKHRYSGIQPRADDVWFIAVDVQHGGAGVTPSGRRGATAPALQGKDEVEQCIGDRICLPHNGLPR
jgi:hypothetical protein